MSTGTALILILACLVILAILAYAQGRADERRARRLRGLALAQGLLSRKARRMEGSTRL